MITFHQNCEVKRFLLTFHRTSIIHPCLSHKVVLIHAKISYSMSNSRCLSVSLSCEIFHRHRTLGDLYTYRTVESSAAILLLREAYIRPSNTLLETVWHSYSRYWCNVKVGLYRKMIEVSKLYTHQYWTRDTNGQFENGDGR